VEARKEELSEIDEEGSLVSTHHDSSGNCPRCEEIFNRYPGFHAGLKKWFKGVQAKNPSAHISCAGRGRQDQEECVARGASLAGWGQSAHNFNCAIDIFFQIAGKLSYDRSLYEANIYPMITPEFEWYGVPDAEFPELPHFQMYGWKDLAKSGKLNLVE
jgi:hypothetical protein